MSQNNSKIRNILANSVKIVFLFFLTILTGCKEEVGDSISLSGAWSVKLDSMEVGDQENWANGLKEANSITLPGTLDDAEMGKASTLEPALNNIVLSSLNRKHEYYGKAWYQKEVKIPGNWEKKDITLELERVLWESKVYVDGHAIGTRESLVGSHVYDLSKVLTPGNHIISVRVDNSDQYPNINVLGNKYPDDADKQMAHGYTNHTQIKWNGILGNIALKASEKSNPTNLQIYPDTQNGKINVEFEQSISNSEGIQFEVLDNRGNSILSETVEDYLAEDSLVKFSIQRPEELKFWDEFSPDVYEAIVTDSGGSTSAKFGYRNISTNDGILQLNDRRIFLRGNLECVIFPLTGYPPMTKEEWSSLISQAKNYGLNHLRFHSWCPPEAAFQAADEAGFYLQVELPHWSLKVGEDKKTTEFLYSEAEKMIQEYGNHPSFVMMAMGNELEGDMNVLNEMTAALKEKDGRHLYATTSFSFQKPSGTRPEPEDEFFIAQWTDKGWIRGQGIFNNQPPSFDQDYSDNISHIGIPVVSHEIGQYSVYPDLSEIEKYTGVLEPLNFIAVKNDLEEKGLLDLADEFTQASGNLAAMLYKEEIERALKTEEFDGFQLLQLQDFPGQGTALVGLLNAFWESKGVISGEEFREFNSEVVPLIRFEKAIYNAGETFKADIEVANFYKEFQDQKINWSISDAEGEILISNSFSSSLGIGSNKKIASIEFPLQVRNAKRLKISVALDGTDFKNSWPIWVYPEVEVNSGSNIVVTSSFEDARIALKQGKKVFLNPELDNIEGITGRFVPVFWSPVHFPDQPGTMGLMINEEHSALQNFPTSSYTEWNWWDLTIKSKSVILDDTDIDPIVRVIDNFVTNHSLANVFQAKVGEGSLLFTSIDLNNNLENRPVAKQLKYSLLEYMQSDEFQPEQVSDWENIENIKK
ncbi:Glycosyl hydrolases family 2, sugar binding domain [Salegentibacter holothuriorum]|uniref:Glycosyl hydrolases family 2, sugar binding domain n=1 Tax=Salegentibacter holothuriorum TaxID=241145 RepID=A0A1T5ENA7_9FLAO|nr:sugar-binding domain-containing protein [Salegentibacter holothuriorum]SKB85444.1 Glycosyl hydrolases family 2, sugar binding domain [Salegentibacter holothuriorum]